MLSAVKKSFRKYLSRHHAMILTYHSVVAKPLPFSLPQHLSVDHFEEQIRYLANNFRCVSLADLVNGIHEQRIEPYSVALTFDDGFANNYTTAYPILRKYNVPATIFVVASYVGSPNLIWPETVACILASTKSQNILLDGDCHPLASSNDKASTYRAITRSFRAHHPDHYNDRLELLMQLCDVQSDEIRDSSIYEQFRMLDRPEINELAASGLVEIASHTLNHWRLTQLTHEQAKHEITESKRLLEESTGIVRYLAYPYGGKENDFNDEHRQIAVQAGYDAIFACANNTITTTSDVYELPRVSIGTDITKPGFEYLLTGGVAFPNFIQVLSQLQNVLPGLGKKP